jgi:hypothetical protein
LREHIAKNAKMEVRMLTSNLRKKHLSTPLVRLFEAKSKKAALKIIKNALILDQDELLKLISTPQLFGFNHSRKHKEFVSDDLSNIDYAALGKAGSESNEFPNKSMKAFRQIVQVFKTRRQLSVHLFQFGFEWHCFYFDFSDLLQQHWSGGDHVHYLSHLWGISRDKVWNGFDKRNFSPGHAHISYRHNLRDR